MSSKYQEEKAAKRASFAQLTPGRHVAYIGEERCTEVILTRNPKGDPADTANLLVSFGAVEDHPITGFRFDRYERIAD